MRLITNRLSERFINKGECVAGKRQLRTSWQAAGMYCEAARYGSSEAVYRLGMLYAFGQGVPASRDFAANLLVSRRVTGISKPKICWKPSRLPRKTRRLVLLKMCARKAPASAVVVTKSPAIDLYIARLPKNKLWLVDMVETIATWHKVDPKLVLSIITTESNFKVNAKSQCGCARINAIDSSHFRTL